MTDEVCDPRVGGSNVTLATNSSFSFYFIYYFYFFFLLAPKKNSSQVAGLATQFGFPSVTSIPATSERAGCLSQCGLREDMHR